MNKCYQILQLIENICSNSAMKCHDVNYALVKKQSGLDTKHFSSTLNYLKEHGYLERSDKSWKMTKAGLDALKSMQFSTAYNKEDASKLASCLKSISEDLHALQRCKMTPNNDWMSRVCKEIDAAIA